MDDFDRSFKRMNRLVTAGFVVVFVMVVAGFGAYGYAAYRLAALGVDGVAHQLGQAAASFKAGMDGR